MDKHQGFVERQGVEQESPWAIIHRARYMFASQYVQGRQVLDVACGTGYGLAILFTGGARRVIGADLSLPATAEARRQIRSEEEAWVVVADARKLPFEGESFDIVTSFETLEHLDNRDLFLAEVRRVLRHDGLCLLSTPNAKHTLPVNGKPRNPHHVHEYTLQELESDLSAYFACVSILGQFLDSRFVIPPFWDEQERLSKNPRMRALVLLWRAMSRLPRAMRDFISQILWGHTFLPQPSDFTFSESDVDRAPVLVALCRGVLG